MSERERHGCEQGFLSRSPPMQSGPAFPSLQ
jgi:hypothetical protein